MIPIIYKDHELLAANAPIDHPRIIQDPPGRLGLDLTNIRACDAIVTILHKLEAKYPGCLKSFLDPKVKSFTIVRKEKNAKPGDNSFLISRKDNIVIAGFFHQPNENGPYIWYRMSKSIFGPDGRWVAIWGAITAVSQPPMSNIWTGDFVHVNRLVPHCDPHNMVEAAKVARQVGAALWCNLIFQVSDEADYSLEKEYQN